MSESQLMQMPGPGDIVIYKPALGAFSVVQKPWGWAHISVQKPQGARGGMVTGQIDTCVSKHALGILSSQMNQDLNVFNLNKLGGGGVHLQHL